MLDTMESGSSDTIASGRPLKRSSVMPSFTNLPWLPSSSYKEIKSFEMQDATVHANYRNDRYGQCSTRSIKVAKTRLPWLSRRTLVLCGFSVFLALSVAALVLLRIIDKQDVGFAVARTMTRYSWKFGPTAIFVVVIAFWRQLEYRIKNQAAWKQIAQGPSPAAVSVLLDYPSPIVPSAFWQSLRNSHWDVALSISVFAILKLAVVFSTGLLSLQLSTLRAKEATTTLARGGERQDVYDVRDQIAISYIG